MAEGTVRVGSWVEVERSGEGGEVWRIVPVEEADARRGLMSEVAPLARAVLGHRAGERVRVQSPAGAFAVTILAVG